MPEDYTSLGSLDRATKMALMFDYAAVLICGALLLPMISNHKSGTKAVESMETLKKQNSLAKENSAPYDTGVRGVGAGVSDIRSIPSTVRPRHPHHHRSDSEWR